MIKGKKFKRRIIDKILVVKPRKGGSPPRDRIFIEIKILEENFNKLRFIFFNVFFLKNKKVQIIKATVKI